MTGRGRKLCNEELGDFYFSSNIVSVSYLERLEEKGM